MKKGKFLLIFTILLAVVFQFTSCIYIPTGQTTGTPDSDTTQHTAETSAPVEDIPVVLFIESIEGSLITGSTLEAGTIMYSNAPKSEPSLTWQWYKSDTIDGTYEKIAGANSTTYKVVSDDLDKYINVSVTASGSAKGSAISDSVKIGQLVLVPFKPASGFYPYKPSAPSGPFSGGKGTEQSPYLITTADQFMLLTSNTTDTYFQLSNNIDLTGKGTIKGKFYGHLDGGNYLVKIHSSSGNGLFAQIAAGASVKNLRITGKNIPIIGVKLKNCSVGSLANENYGTIYGCSVQNFETEIYNAVKVKAGGLVGVNYGVIEKSYTKGHFLLNLEKCEAINGYYPSLADDLFSDWNKGWGGGLVAVNKKGGIIKNCYSHMNVSVDAQGELTYGIVGGLVARNEGDVFFCYSCGATSRTDWRGGLVGINDNGKVENSYYDTQTSNRSDNEGKGMPKTTIEMKTASTYVGWSSDVWIFYNDLSKYPDLKK